MSVTNFDQFMIGGTRSKSAEKLQWLDKIARSCRIYQGLVESALSDHDITPSLEGLIYLFGWTAVSSCNLWWGDAGRQRLTMKGHKTRSWKPVHPIIVNYNYSWWFETCFISVVVKFWVFVKMRMNDGDSCALHKAEKKGGGTFFGWTQESQTSCRKVAGNEQWKWGQHPQQGYKTCCAPTVRTDT